MQYETHKLPSHTRMYNAANVLGIIAGKKKPPVTGAKFIVGVLTVSVPIRFDAEPHSAPRHNHAISNNIIVSGAPELQISPRLGISSPSSTVNLQQSLALLSGQWFHVYLLNSQASHKINANAAPNSPNMMHSPIISAPPNQ